MPNTRSDTSSMQTYQRLLRVASPYWPYFLGSTIAMILFATTDAAFAGLLKEIIDSSIVDKSHSYLILGPLLLVGLASLRAVTGFLYSYGMMYVSRMTIYTIRKKMFEHLMLLPSSIYDASSTGQIISKFTFNTEQISQAITSAVTVLIRDSVSVLVLLAVMMYWNFWLTIMFLICGPFIVIILALLSSRFRKISKRIQHSMGDVTSVLQESIEAQREVKTFAGQEHEQTKFEAINKTNRQQNMKFLSVTVGSSQLIQFFAAVMVAVIIYFLISDESSTAGSFTGYVTAMLLLLPPIKRLTTVNASIQKGIAAAGAIFELLDETPENDTGTYTNTKVKGNICFEHVSMSYDEGKSMPLQDIHLTISPGQTVALVGKSGSGKTSMIGLLPRFYEMYSGKIMLDSVDIADYTLASLRSQMSIVSQNIVLFNDSIANNIAYGAMANATRAQVKAAAISAHADEFIQHCEQGYDTLIGEDGSRLSGGQRQRIAIARALLKDAPILLLDEATSALDSESEQAVQAGIELLVKNRTTLVVAHRLSTIEKADVILVLDSGKIVESGTHQELLVAEGFYAAYHQAQISGSIDS
ncbi:Lipid A export permease/ATP-binding protein MsbA [hydrothermal vent metagenome]|uniref:Lipid A export permease/ATP-binding protein MsbA n=1 Tax=hydrothermal vent metagenome TaxID=652676 RepID=A0A3B0YZV3_9ZZZZ